MLPTIPSLPTDNLYKFLALAGFFAFIVFTSFLVFEEYDWLLKNQHVESLIDGAKEDQVRLDELHNDFEQEVIKAKGLSSEEISESVTTLKSVNQEMINLNNSKKKKTDEAEKKLIPMKVQMESNKVKIAKKGSCLGLALALLGFTLWFFRVQIHQDKILRLNTLKAEIEYKKASLEFEELNRRLLNVSAEPSRP